MSEIKPGDLVMVVRAHCASQLEGIGGEVGTVTGIAHSAAGIVCPHCRQVFASGEPHAELTADRWHPIAWLKKFEPPADLAVEEIEHAPPAPRLREISWRLDA